MFHRFFSIKPILRKLAKFCLAIVSLVAVLLVLGLMGIHPIKLVIDSPADASQPNLQAAPELSGGTDWLNVSKPLSLPDLRGRIVILDFWTLCCINCIHVLPDLAKLEKKYPNELVVIGCHTAKFANEKDSASIRKA